MKIYTASVRSMAGSMNPLDITVKGGDKTFAPSWEIVMGFKNGKVTAEQYTATYVDMMRKSWVNNRQRWDEVLAMDEVTLVCYCPSGSFCHRYLLAEMLVKAAASVGVSASYAGEV